MISRYEVWLDGQPLSGIDPDIYVANIDHELKVSRDTQTRAQGGSYVGKENIESISVKVPFAVETYDIAERQAIVTRITAWAAGSHWLETNDRPGQRLRVVCEDYPSITSAKQWTSELQMTFSAYDWPYWQDVSPTTADDEAVASTAKTTTLICPGAYPAPLEFEVTAGGTLGSVTVSVGNYSMTLSSLNMAANDVLRLFYTDDRHILCITKNGFSAISARSAASSDDLLLQPGENTISITGDAALDVTYSVRGLTL